MNTAKTRNIIFDNIPGGTIGAEIGVWKGDFSAQLLASCQPAMLHLIDPWKFQPDFNKSWYGNETMSEKKMDEIYENVKTRFKTQTDSGTVDIHRTSSSAAANLFDDEYFDWVYIDGNHDYMFVLEDLHSFFPKIKRGGLITGDDYNLEGWWDDGVTKAVHQFLAEMQNEVLIVGAENHQFVLKRT